MAGPYVASALGEDSDLDASVTYLNPMKAAGWIVLIGILGGLGSVYFRKTTPGKGP